METIIPTLPVLRQLALRRALETDLPGGRLKLSGPEPAGILKFFNFILPEAEFAAVAAFAWSDQMSPNKNDAQLPVAALAALEHVVGYFQSDGRVGSNDMNSPYFCLVPFTAALLALRAGGADPGRVERLVAAGIQLFDDAAAHIPRAHEYLNPRGMEAAAALGLHRLTGEKRFLERCRLCIGKLLEIQYPCGAQPYHTGSWVWGRRPARAYQLLTATMMLHVGRQLNWPEVEAYVRRLMDYEVLATTRRAEPFVTCFEGLLKARRLMCCAWQWPLAVALGEARYAPLAGDTYRLWATTRDLSSPPSIRTQSSCSYLRGLVNAQLLGVTEVPPAERFVPPQGVKALADISTVLVHEPQLDLAMTLLTGYSAFAEADCGSVRLVALTPELTDKPNHDNAGTDALRQDWRVPSEQLACEQADGRSLLRGRVFTKWEQPYAYPEDLTRLHCRELEVTLRYEAGELLLEFQTVCNQQISPVSARLLLLLAVRPEDAQPRLTIGTQSYQPPAARETKPFFVEAPLGTVRFTAPDGSAIEIVPELSCAIRVTAERPYAAGSTKNDQPPPSNVELKTAPEGSLRLAFEGPNVFDQGRYRIRFLPQSK